MKREDFKAEMVDEPEKVEEEIVDEVVEEKKEEVAEVETESKEVEQKEEEQEEEEKPFWLSEDDTETEEEESSETIPLARLLKEKNKRKEANAEIEELRRELEELKNNSTTQNQQSTSPTKRPRILDFNSDEEYEEAMDKWEQEFGQNIVNHITNNQTKQYQQKQVVDRVQKEVSKFYERAETLLKQHSIQPEAYVTATRKVVDSLDKINPGNGEALFNSLVATVGEHSEKIIYHVGRNTKALSEFQSLLLDDPSGSKALVYLGSLKSKALENKNKRSSRAPAPSASVQGESTATSTSESKLKKQWEEAHRKGDAQKAYNLRAKARQSGIDVNKW